MQGFLSVAYAVTKYTRAHLYLFLVANQVNIPTYTQQKKKRTCDSTGIFSGMEFIWLRQRYMTEISNLSEIKICLLICYCVRQVCAVDRLVQQGQ